MIASYFEILKDKTVKCMVCPHECILHEGKTGICRIRKNISGQLHVLTYQKYAAVSFDPIEKKPLYHFHPGKEILSIGSVGCNFSCKWCQNCEISQVGTNSSVNLTNFTHEDLLRIAQNRPDNIGIAFTYNEPMINAESNIEIAGYFKKNNYKTVMVTNGFISGLVLKDYLEVIDAFNVDVKAFNDTVYRKYTRGRLHPVLNNMKLIVESGKHLEVTWLVVPEVNDDSGSFREFCSWLKENTGNNTILHISRYFPRFEMDIDLTPEDTLLEFANIASRFIKYVYIGNIRTSGFNNTLCPECQTNIIMRLGYMIRINEKVKDGNCPYCGRKIFIY